MKRRLCAVSAVCALVFGLAACGGDGERPARRGLAANVVLVTQRDILKFGPRTPERSLMLWWRAMQYTDARGYLNMLAEPLKERLRETRAYRVQLPIIARYVESAYPHVKRVAITGDRATVYTEIEFRNLVGADKYGSRRLAQAFALVREGETWRIADDLFVEAGTDSELRRRVREQGSAGVPEVRTVTVQAPPEEAPAVPILPGQENSP